MNNIVFSPHDSDSAARFLAECTRLAREENEISVHIGGKESGDTVPDETGLEKLAQGGISASITYDNLSGIVELSPPDMLIRAKGGTPVSDVASTVEESMLWFPHYDSSIGREMTVATLLMGAPELSVPDSLGGLREYVLSIELVTGAGEKTRFGSRSVKDVAGYEVIGLLLGGGGRYGMITEATLRLIPGKTGKPEDIGMSEHRHAPDTDNTGSMAKLTEAVCRIFDPAGILR